MQSDATRTTSSHKNKMYNFLRPQSWKIYSMIEYAGTGHPTLSSASISHSFSLSRRNFLVSRVTLCIWSTTWILTSPHLQFLGSKCCGPALFCVLLCMPFDPFGSLGRKWYRAALQMAAKILFSWRHQEYVRGAFFPTSVWRLLAPAAAFSFQFSRDNTAQKTFFLSERAKGKHADPAAQYFSAKMCFVDDRG